MIEEFARECQLKNELKNKLRHALTYSTEKTGFNWNDQ